MRHRYSVLTDDCSKQQRILGALLYSPYRIGRTDNNKAEGVLA